MYVMTLIHSQRGVYVYVMTLIHSQRSLCVYNDFNTVREEFMCM